jgi:hypothetical protein
MPPSVLRLRCSRSPISVLAPRSSLLPRSASSRHSRSSRPQDRPRFVLYRYRCFLLSRFSESESELLHFSAFFGLGALGLGSWTAAPTALTPSRQQVVSELLQSAHCQMPAGAKQCGAAPAPAISASPQATGARSTLANATTGGYGPANCELRMKDRPGAWKPRPLSCPCRCRAFLPLGTGAGAPCPCRAFLRPPSTC